MMKKLALILVMFFLVAGCASTASKKDVATVNGESITKKEFDLRVTKMKVVYEAQGQPMEEKKLKEQVLESLIEEKIVSQAAKKQGVDVPVKEAELQLAEVKKNFKTEVEWKSILDSRHLTEQDMVKYFHNQMVAEQLTNKLGGVEKVKSYIADLKKKAEIKKMIKF